MKLLRYRRAQLVVAFVWFSMGFLPGARAASIFFTPEGTELDKDPILDLGRAAGEQVVFDVNLNTTGNSDCSKDPLDRNADFRISPLSLTSVGGDNCLGPFPPAAQIVEVQPDVCTPGQNLVSADADLCSAPEPATAHSIIPALCVMAFVGVRRRRSRR